MAPAGDARFYVLAPFAAVLLGMLGLVMMLLSHLVISAVHAPAVYLTLVHAACVSKKLGIIAKTFSTIVLVVAVLVAIPVLALYGGIAGLCWGTIAGIEMCGAAEPNASHTAYENFRSLNFSFVQALDSLQEECGKLLVKARTEELGPDEKPFELNPIRAAVALVAALILGCVGAVVDLLIGVRYYPRMICSTQRFMLDGGNGEPPTPSCHPYRLIIYAMLPVLGLLLLLLYPFLGFAVNFLATGACGYTELTIEQVMEKLSPPKQKKEASKWWPSQWSVFKQTETNEPLLPVEPPKPSCGYQVCHFVGFTGIPSAVAAMNQCISYWYVFNKHMAEEGLQYMFKALSDCCHCCESMCQCCNCCCTCCGCCPGASARELEYEQAWQERDVECGGEDLAAPEQLTMVTEGPHEEAGPAAAGDLGP